MQGMELKKSAYLETTMFNYFFDEVRDGHLATVAFFEAVGRGEIEAYTSQYVIGELQAAAEPKQSDMLALIDRYHIVILERNDEAERLADMYIAANDGIPAKKQLDATHIAVASVRRLQYVVSWNFKHINKERTRNMVRYINPKEGYEAITLCEPWEVIYDGTEAEVNVHTRRGRG
jgi:predicted nucleic acid-binding protein